ncbi:MAG: dihydroxyacetone kinase subunit L [Clostridiales bacterium]|jgi:dihydroxyacetone kinase-like protein|nr:dihydroxyacetone kinase subunit L [Clostridiales bacterium]
MGSGDQHFNQKDGAGVIIYDLTAVIQKNRDYLSEVDGATGDGDHGVNMGKGFSRCRERLDGRQNSASLAEAMDELGDILLSEIGGSMGPLYGTFFMDMAESISGKEQIGAAEFAAMLKAGLEGIRSLVDTKVGDKSLLDVLVPSIGALDGALGEGKPFAECLRVFRGEAERAKESTKDMVAKVGRASRLGERSRGFYDAGAVSCALILESIADSVAALIS